jgi:hypothetical protein
MQKKITDPLRPAIGWTGLNRRVSSAYCTTGKSDPAQGGWGDLEYLDFLHG